MQIMNNLIISKIQYHKFSSVFFCLFHSSTSVFHTQLGAFILLLLLYNIYLPIQLFRLKSLKFNPDLAKACFRHVTSSLARSHRSADFKSRHESTFEIHMLALSPSEKIVFPRSPTLTVLRFPFSV